MKPNNAGNAWLAALTPEERASIDAWDAWFSSRSDDERAVIDGLAALDAKYGDDVAREARDRGLSFSGHGEADPDR